MLRFLVLALLALQAQAATTCPKYPVKYFAQKLDHASDASSETFQQSYQLDTTHFKPGGTILFYQWAETENYTCLERRYFDGIAEELGGIVCGLEHRFFGDSFPAGVSSANATAKDYAALTLDNTLSDSAAFVEWVKKTVPGACDSRAFIFGGK